MGFWQKLFGGKPKQDEQEQAPDAAKEQPSAEESAPAEPAAPEGEAMNGPSEEKTE